MRGAVKYKIVRHGSQNVKLLLLLFLSHPVTNIVFIRRRLSALINSNEHETCQESVDIKTIS